MKIRWQNPFDYFDQIYYINLDSRVDRREQVEHELFTVRIDRAKRIQGIVHENPAHGCHLSHAKALEDAIMNGYDRILIFEDDVEFFPGAYVNMHSALKELPTQWDMFYLGANLDRFPAYEISDHIARLEGAFATHAYAIRRTLFNELYDINASLDTIHNDVVYTERIHNKYSCYLALPLIAGQRDSYSDIQKTVMSSNSVFQEKLKTNLVKRP